MIRGLAKHIVILLVYIGYFTVQMGSNFVIQENIRFSQDRSAFESSHSHQEHLVGELIQCKKNGNFKKASLNKRFCSSTKNEFDAVLSNEPIQFFTVNTITSNQTGGIQKSEKSQFEDRGPPAWV